MFAARSSVVAVVLVAAVFAACSLTVAVVLVAIPLVREVVPYDRRPGPGPYGHLDPTPVAAAPPAALHVAVAAAPDAFLCVAVAVAVSAVEVGDVS